MLIDVKDLYKIYNEGQESEVRALDGISLSIDRGEFVAIIGASGSGKSTLMNILGCLDRPTSGSYKVNGQETGKLEPDQLAQLRREYFGFIFQRYHLLGDLSAEGNVEVPAVYAGVTPADRKQRATALLTELGLGTKTQNRPSQLSGGQQQRLCIARAISVKPDILLMDEPASALDPIATAQLEETMLELKKDFTIIIVTHSMQQAARASDYTGFFYLGDLIEYDKTSNIFQNAKLQSTNDYVTGHFG